MPPSVATVHGRCHVWGARAFTDHVVASVRQIGQCSCCDGHVISFVSGTSAPMLLKRGRRWRPQIGCI
eukprot:11200556-Lingulodinium_polyedra.AAC.1